MKKAPALCLALGFFLFAACRRDCSRSVGPTAGRLSPCPESPNCVFSRAPDAKHRVEPLSFDGPADAARAKLKAAIAAMPRAKIAAEQGPYLRAEFSSCFFRFVDDVEFLFGDGLIDVRSASRVGYSDLGVNRRRVERLRAAFAAPRPSSP